MQARKMPVPGDPDFIGPSYDTRLDENEEAKFQAWKRQHAPFDSGQDYDYRGAYKAGVTANAKGHWPDTYKKPNHPTFSDESIYASQAPGLAGHWDGEKYTPGRGLGPGFKE